jgi:pyridoxamine 5'-phosphate oxidase family protein
MIFKPREIAYLQAARLGRLATIAPNGSPQASPVGFTYNEQLETIDISGYRMSQSQKFRNIATNDKVAFVVDDIASRNPWRVRCLEIRGTAEQATAAEGQLGAAGDGLDSAIIRITPRRIISFGLDDAETEPHLLTPDRRNVNA